MMPAALAWVRMHVVGLLALVDSWTSPSVSVRVWDPEGYRLVLRRSPTAGTLRAGNWVEPGGLVRLDESPEEAAVRELREETGIEVQPGWLRELPFESITLRFGVEFDHRPVVQLSDEHDAFKWVR